jgi:hypothetical protein
MDNTRFGSAASKQAGEKRTQVLVPDQAFSDQAVRHAFEN